LDKNDHGKQIVVTEAAPKQPPRQNKVSNDVGASTSNNGNNGTWVPIPVASTVNITQRVPVTATTAPISTSSVSVPTPQMGPIVSSTVAAPEFDRSNNFSIPLQNVFDLITPSELPLQRPVLELVSPVKNDDMQPVEVRKLTKEPRKVELNPLVTENTESLLDSVEHNHMSPRELGESPKESNVRGTHSSPRGHEDMRPNGVEQTTQTSLVTSVTDDVSEPRQDGVEQDHVSPRELERVPKVLVRLLQGHPMLSMMTCKRILLIL
jgi:hypothetical protein